MLGKRLGGVAMAPAAAPVTNIFLINIFLQEMAQFNPISFWNNVLVQNETVEKYSNVHSLVKPIESIFAKTKVLSPGHMMHPILD